MTSERWFRRHQVAAEGLAQPEYVFARRSEILGARQRKPKHNARATVEEALARWEREEMAARTRSAVRRLERVLP